MTVTEKIQLFHLISSLGILLMQQQSEEGAVVGGVGERDHAGMGFNT